MSAIDELLARHRRVDLVVPDRPQPALRVVIVTCMDCRIDPTAILGLAPGDAHVLRNAGGIVTDDIIRSIAISQHRLGTRAVMVIQHTGCGMQALSEDELVDELRRNAGVSPPFAIGAFTDLIASVRDAVATIASSPFVRHRSEVRGFVLDVATQTLSAVGSAETAPD